MMGIETALIGSALIGGASAMAQSSNSSRAAEKAQEADANAAAQQQRLQLYNEQRYMESMGDYERMKAIYGPLQEDIGTYFTNLSGESLSNDRVAKIQQASQKAQNKIQADLAQSGRSNTGLEQYLLSQNTYQTEMNKAQTRVAAETDALNQQMQYLGVATNQANQYHAQADNYFNAASGNVANIGNLGQHSAGIGMQNAGQQNRLIASYADQLTDLVGFKYRKDEASNQAMGRF